jgi:hypothetical protein
LCNCPNVIRNARLHGRYNAQRLVNSAKVVVSEVQPACIVPHVLCYSQIKPCLRLWPARFSRCCSQLLSHGVVVSRASSTSCGLARKTAVQARVIANRTPSNTTRPQERSKTPVQNASRLLSVLKNRSHYTLISLPLHICASVCRRPWPGCLCLVVM